MKDSNIVFLLKSSPLGVFYEVSLDPDMEYKRFIAMYKYKLPEDYAIKRLSDNSKIVQKNYGLLCVPRVIKTICNGQYVVSTTNQNMISVWQKATMFNQ